MRKAHFILSSFVLVIAPACLIAQTPPCGKAIVQIEGPKNYEQFVAAPPEQVKAALLKAIPALGAKVHKDEGLHIETEDDTALRQSLQQTNKDSGIRGKYEGLGALGKIFIDIRETTQGAEKGSLLHIEFHKNGFVGRMGGEGYSKPLAEETACLVKLLGPNDPVRNPRGFDLHESSPARALTLPEGTALQVFILDPLYSKKVQKEGVGQTIQFEVADDVVVDGVTVVRRGALATAHMSEVQKSKIAGRHAEMDFVFDAVTAVDGQSIPIKAEDEKAKGGRHNETVRNLMITPAFGWIAKGSEAFIRAGTGYDVAVSGQHTIQSGQ
jgi:hypothetical protein